MSFEKTFEKLEIHYYLENGSHSMNAFIRNKAERDLLDALNRIAFLYGVEINLETEAYTEGGLKEKIIAGVITGSGTLLLYFQSAINETFTYYATKQHILQNKQIEKLDAEIRALNIENKKNELETRILEDKHTKRLISNYYKKIDGYNKVFEIGYKNLDSGIEYRIGKSQFKNFILEDETDEIVDDNADLEIISPIFKEGKYKWKGLYNGEVIQFSMGDTSYKEEVINGKQIFGSGSVINCKIVIKITYDEFGDEKRKSYSVKEVYGKKDTPLDEIRYTNLGQKKIKKEKENKNQTTMFDFLDNEDV